MSKISLFFLFSILSLISLISSFKCVENENHCVKCNPITNVCIKCDLDVYKPDLNGGCYYSNQCENGKNYCQECNERGVICKTCEIGYFPDENGGCSYTDNCLISYKGECLECSDNYILIGDPTEEKGFKFCKFSSSIDFINCKIINKTTGLCEECEENYYLDQGDKRCTKTNNCYESVYGVCGECNMGYYLNKKENDCKRKEYPFILCKETIDGEHCEKCDDDSFMAEDGKCVDCNFCSVSYDTKLSCKECIDNYYLTKNKRACSDEKNCVNADKETGLCDECEEGNYLTKERKCESNKEDDIFKNCKIAKEDYCTECLYGYYLSDDNQCTPSPNCTEAMNGICILCNDNYFLGKDNVCTTVNHCAKTDYYKNCVECEDNYYFDLSDKTCKEATDVFSNCLESTSNGEICLKCRDNYYISLLDNLCYSNEEKGAFYKCAISLDGEKCYQCIDGYHTGLKDNKCTEGYVCLYSNEDHICQECRYDYCLNKANGKCFINYEISDELFYYKCLKSNDEGTKCVECAENYELTGDGLCISLNDCEIKENDTCQKCNEKNNEDNFLCANKYFGCVETMVENCIRCDDSDTNICTECKEGYELDFAYKCVKI